MFDHIVLRQSENGLPITAGQIAEALLYYQKVHLFIDRSTLFNLIQQIGISHLMVILRRAEVSAVYCEEGLATSTNSVGVSQYHNFAAIRLAGHEGVGSLKTTRERLQYELERKINGISKMQVKRFIKVFLDKVPIRKLSGDHYLKGGIINAAKSDLLDNDFARKAFSKAIANTAGGYSVGDDHKVELIHSGLGMFVFTNIDMGLINQRRAQAAPSIEPLTIAYILNSILAARADLALSSFYGGDFVTSAATSAIIQVQHEELLRRSKLNVDSRRQFTEVVLPDSPSLAETIDSGERSFDDFLRLLDRSDRFKDWLKSVNPDEDLIRTYMRDISSDGWIQRLPTKILRYAFTLGLEVVDPTVGIGAGLADNFVLEKLFSGWRPNHFVTGKLAPFVQTY